MTRMGFFPICEKYQFFFPSRKQVKKRPKVIIYKVIEKKN